MDSWKEFLHKLYFNIGKPGSFAGPVKLRAVLKSNGYNVSLRAIKLWLEDQDAYSLLRPVRYRFKRDTVITCGIDYMWDGDLADVSNIEQYNSGIKYLLVLIDVFSRYLWISPLLNKTSEQVKTGFELIFQSETRRPARLRTDKGREFTNKTIKAIMQRERIKLFTTKNETKANYAERVIRTIKSLMYRYFLHKQTYKFDDVLQDLVNNYNNSPHSSLYGYTPAEINTQNEASLWKRMYIDTAKPNIKNKKFRFKKGDYVRISHVKYQFQRDYHQKWTEEYFIIYRCQRRRSINVYYLQDLMNEKIDGMFYESELQKVNKNVESALLRVEKVIKRRRRRGQEELYVKWMGWPKKFNSWVPSSSVEMY